MSEAHKRPKSTIEIPLPSVKVPGVPEGGTTVGKVNQKQIAFALLEFLRLCNQSRDERTEWREYWEGRRGLQFPVAVERKQIERTYVPERGATWSMLSLAMGKLFKGINERELTDYPELILQRHVNAVVKAGYVSGPRNEHDAYPVYLITPEGEQRLEELAAKLGGDTDSKPTGEIWKAVEWYHHHSNRIKRNTLRKARKTKRGRVLKWREGENGILIFELESVCKWREDERQTLQQKRNLG